MAPEFTGQRVNATIGGGGGGFIGDKIASKAIASPHWLAGAGCACGPAGRRTNQFSKPTFKTQLLQPEEQPEQATHTLGRPKTLSLPASSSPAYLWLPPPTPVESKVGPFGATLVPSKRAASRPDCGRANLHSAEVAAAGRLAPSVGQVSRELSPIRLLKLGRYSVRRRRVRASGPASRSLVLHGASASGGAHCKPKRPASRCTS